MDFVCNFGRSIDVDGDEWIDLGPPSVEIEEPNMEPEPEQPDTDNSQQQTQQKKDKSVKLTNPQLPQSVPMLKAAKSKEALMAFYLGRAKQMEAKHRKIVVSELSAPIGL